MHASGALLLDPVDLHRLDATLSAAAPPAPPQDDGSRAGGAAQVCRPGMPPAWAMPGVKLTRTSLHDQHGLLNAASNASPRLEGCLEHLLRVASMLVQGWPSDDQEGSSAQLGTAAPGADGCEANQDMLWQDDEHDAAPGGWPEPASVPPGMATAPLVPGRPLRQTHAPPS